MDRVSFLKLAFEPKGAVCIHFAASASDCEERVAKRTDHPTIKFGGGRGAVRSMQDSFFIASVFSVLLMILEEKDAKKAQKTQQCFLFLFFCFFLICWRSTNIIFLMQFLSVFAVSQTGQDALVLPSPSEGFEEVLTIHTFEDR